MDVLEALAAIRDERRPTDAPSMGEWILNHQRRRDDLIVQARDRGCTLRAVAEAAGVSEHHVCRVLEWETTP